ncbi:hypothetical protein [Stutzerimonas stutzeri]|uniref:Uncharacterized protein n=1 Tax=Stutzerimonas stutzeri TaxID=316 RepID=A0A172WRU3_STUST|nr:hypothetical protein [Stutzerimonas stutzeri]ANF25999.1 hypothetical protein PS273GM_13025 [Stutzerimonas stutzeri]
MSKEVKRYTLYPQLKPEALAFLPDVVVDAKDYDALLAENVSLRGLYKMHKETETRETRDLRSERDALLAERDALKKALDRQVPLNEAIQRAAGELPNGWEIRLCVERDAGWVELYDPDGNDIEDFATDAERLDYTVIDALEHALQGEQPCT